MKRTRQAFVAPIATRMQRHLETVVVENVRLVANHWFNNNMSVNPRHGLPLFLLAALVVGVFKSALSSEAVVRMRTLTHSRGFTFKWSQREFSIDFVYRFLNLIHVGVDLVKVGA